MVTHGAKPEALRALGGLILKSLALELADTMRASTTVDWQSTKAAARPCA